jgi:hypothetical protein
MGFNSAFERLNGSFAYKFVGEQFEDEYFNDIVLAEQAFNCGDVIVNYSRSVQDIIFSLGARKN